MAARSLYGEAVPERLGINIPIDSTNTDGSTFRITATDSYPASSFPNIFTIKAETDSTYLENESIRVQVVVVVLGNSANPTFDSFSMFSNELTFDLVEGELPDPTAKPTTPDNLRAEALRGAVALTWDAVDTSGSNTNVVNDVQITKHQYCRKTDAGSCAESDWQDIPNSAFRGIHATTFVIGGLANGTAYTFRVRAVNGCTPGCGNSDPSAAFTATPETEVPPAPTGLRAEAGNAQVTLTWDDPREPDIFYYQWQRGEGGVFGLWRRIHDSHAATTRFILSRISDPHITIDVHNGVLYAYRIRAVHADGFGAPSAIVTARPMAAAPARPTNFAAYLLGEEIRLRWDDPDDHSITAYAYQWKSGAGSYGVWTNIDVPTGRRDPVSNPKTSHTVSSLPGEGPYTFRLRASNTAGDGPASAEATAAAPNRAPGQLTGVRALPEISDQEEQTSGEELGLTWAPPHDPTILRYEYQLKTGNEPFGSWLLLQGARGLADGVIPDLTPGLTYTVRLRAVNGVGPGRASDPVTATPQPRDERAAAFVQRLHANPGNGQVTLTWAPPEPARERDSIQIRVRVGSVNMPRYHASLPGDATSYTVRGLTNGVEYTFNLTAPNAGRSLIDPGAEVTATPGAPMAPTSLRAIPGDGQITLVWDDQDNSDVTGYEYYVSTTPQNYATFTANWTPVAGSGPTTTRHTIGSLTNGTSYYLGLRATGAPPRNFSSPPSRWRPGRRASPRVLSRYMLVPVAPQRPACSGTIPGTPASPSIRSTVPAATSRNGATLPTAGPEG